MSRIIEIGVTCACWLLIPSVEEALRNTLLSRKVNLSYVTLNKR